MNLTMNKSQTEDMARGFDQFRHGFRTAAIWTKRLMPGDDEQPGDFSSRADWIDSQLSAETRAAMNADANVFLMGHYEHIAVLVDDDSTDYDWGDAGQAYLLSSSGMGCGFSDESDNAEIREALDESAGYATEHTYLQVDDPDNPNTWTWE